MKEHTKKKFVLIVGRRLKMNSEEIKYFCRRLSDFADDWDKADKGEMNDMEHIKEDFVNEFNTLFEVEK